MCQVQMWQQSTSLFSAQLVSILYATVFSHAGVHSGRKERERERESKKKLPIILCFIDRDKAHHVKGAV